MKTRAYQTKAVSRIASLKPGAVGLFVGPTGCGKTVIAAQAIRRCVNAGGRALFIAARATIIRQTYETLIGMLPKSKVGVIMAADAGAEGGVERVRPNAPVQVASIQTLANRDLPEADLVIIDEAHHALADQYETVVLGYERSVIVGVTATPYRTDGAGLGTMFESLYVIAQPSQLLAEGYLVEPRVYAAPKTADDLRKMRMRGIRTSGGDYAPAALGVAMSNGILMGHIIKEWKRLNVERFPTVVFAASVEHSVAIMKRFKRSKIGAAHIDADTPEQERREILASLADPDSELRVVCNYDVLGEGWDLPAVKCLVMARPTKSEVVYMQRCGRVLRPFNGQTPIIIDHSGSAIRFGMPQQDREHRLDGIDERLNGTKDAPVKQCPDCQLLVPTGVLACPSCDHQFIVEKTQEEIDVELRQLEVQNIIDRAVAMGFSREVGEEMAQL